MDELLVTYEEHHAALVTYLLVKVEARDWHGVSDAANDLRVLEATQESCVRSRADRQEVALTPEGPTIYGEPTRIHGY